MQWSWQTPDFVNDINHAIYEVESLSSTEAMAGGFSSGTPSRNGMEIVLESVEKLFLFLARLHEVHRAIVVTSVVPVYVYVYVYVRVRVTLSVKVFYKSISLDHVDGSS